MHNISASPVEQDVHPWLHKINLFFVPGQTTPLLEGTVAGLRDAFRALGHTVQDAPDERTDLLLTSAPFARPINWREAVMFTGRLRFRLAHTPTTVTLIHARPAEFQDLLRHFETALKKEPLDPADFAFEGLAATSHETLI